MGSESRSGDGYHVCRNCGLAENRKDALFFSYKNVPTLAHKVQDYVVGAVRDSSAILNLYLTSSGVNYAYVSHLIAAYSEDATHTEFYTLLRNKLKELYDEE